VKVVKMERTCVIVKPDGVSRNLTGEIISRFEKAGLKIIALKMIVADRELIKKHYTENEEYLISLGKKSEKAGDVVKDYRAQGLMIVEGMRNYMTSGPVVPMVVEGENAIKKAREIAGYTDPSAAEKGTIRGDLGQDSILKANKEKRPVKNLLHASGNPEEAEHEIKLWFKEKELVR
jgi:nucleoside-diphosphate kinase